jgi:hypothetical protein
MYELVTQPLIISDAEKFHKIILNADYSAVDIDAMVNKYDHLTSDEKMKLIDVLHRHSLLFSGGLGTCINILPL